MLFLVHAVLDFVSVHVAVHAQASASDHMQSSLACRQSQEDYQAAVDVLLLAEEAFSMCNPKHLEMVDNVGLLMIDIVW